MTLQESIESGRKFKRPNHPMFLTTRDYVSFDAVLVWDTTPPTRAYFTAEAILANDWELEDE